MKLIQQPKEFKLLEKVKERVEKFFTENPAIEPITEIENFSIFKLSMPTRRLTGIPTKDSSVIFDTVIVATDSTKTPVYIAAFSERTEGKFKVGKHKMVWKDSNLVPTRALSDNVFFNVSMKSFDIIETDIFHTDRAKASWLSKMKHAIDNGLFVYMITTNGPEKILTRINDIKQLDESDSILWNISESGRNVKSAISNVEIYKS